MFASKLNAVDVVTSLRSVGASPFTPRGKGRVRSGKTAKDKANNAHATARDNKLRRESYLSDRSRNGQNPATGWPAGTSLPTN